MSEFENRRKYEIEESDRRRVKRLSDMVRNIIHYEKATDLVEDAFLRALYPQLANDGQVGPHLQEVFAFKRASGSYFPDGYALRSLEFAVDKQIRQNIPGDIYPRRFVHHTAFYKYGIFDLIDYNDLFSDMQENLRSNIQLGYEIFDLLSLIHKDRWGYNPTVVDSGASLGLGLKKWILHDQYPFKPIQTVKPPRPGQAITLDLEPDQQAQEQVNFLVSQAPVIGEVIGFDNVPILQNQPESAELVFSHTFPMMESERDSDGVIEFELLLEESPPSLQMLPLNIDATDPTSLTQLGPYLPGGKADIFTFSASYFEMEPSKQANFFKNFLPYCNDGALFFVSEFARLDTRAPNGLKIIRGDWWHRLGSFATFEIDPFHPEQPPKEICRFLTRRCETMWLTEAGKQMFGSVAP